MQDHDAWPTFCIGMFMGAAIAGVICAIANSSNENAWKSDAIKHHAAHFDAQTGVFTWNDEAKP